MIVLGFNCHTHNSAACLMADGHLVAGAEQERFSRLKNDGRFPALALDACLRQAGATMDDVDQVAFYWDPVHGLGRRFVQVARHARDASRLQHAHGARWWNMLSARRDFGAWAAGRTARRAHYAFTRIRHHDSHAASAFLLSPFDEAAIWVVDGTGEIASTSCAVGRGARFEMLAEVEYPHSMGYLFVAMTHFLGFTPESDEYKLMSLASYGSDRFYPAFCELIRLTDNGGFRVDPAFIAYHRGVRDPWFSPRFVEKFGPPRRRDEPLGEREADLAWALQRRLEDVGLHAARYLAKRTGLRRLCVAGGVALNAVMNQRLRRDGPFDEVFVQPVANDAGCSLGTASAVTAALTGRRPEPLGHVFLGPSYSREACRRAIVEAGGQARWRSEAELLRDVARRLAEGQVIGWFQGRMEMGPRALGNRSILADPRRADMQQVLNERVKHRESFRPFAPVIPQEDVATYFETSGPLPFMVVVVPVRPEKRDALPAVTHVDGTARVQTVDRTVQPRLWGLLRAFEGVTGVPVLVNTSFNTMGEPIVATPQDAVRCFRSTNIDALVLESYVIDKAQFA